MLEMECEAAVTMKISTQEALFVILITQHALVLQRAYTESSKKNMPPLDISLWEPCQNPKCMRKLQNNIEHIPC